MKALGWLALGAGAGLGFLAACFVEPVLVGPYKCDQLTGQCPLTGFDCVQGVCCKSDGGIPACSPIILPEDGGCTISPSDPFCTYISKVGMCRDGGWSCATGIKTCTQIVFPRSDVCNGADDDCDGVDDNYPCRGGPHDFLTPGTDFASGAMVASKDLLPAHSSCLLNDLDLNYYRDGGYLDGGNWRAAGAVTHFVYFQKDGGGTWDVSANGEVLNLSLSGALIRGVAAPYFFAGYLQPIVYLCGPGSPEGYRRYNPKNPNILTWSGSSFFLNTSIDLINGSTGPNGDWYAPSIGGGDLRSIYRVEILLAPKDPLDGGTPAFDAGITALGFFPL